MTDKNNVMERIVLIGASGHGKVCADIAELLGYTEILFLDDDESVKNCGRFRVEDCVSEFRKYLNEGTGFFVSIGNAENRRRIQTEILRAGGRIETLLHPDSVIGTDVVFGKGCVTMAGSVINTGTVLGDGVIVNTCGSVDHDCRIGNYCHIAVGAHVCGGVVIGNNAWIGAGAVINNYHNVCGDVIIGSGAVVTKDLETPGVYVGVPAKKKKAIGERTY